MGAELGAAAMSLLEEISDAGIQAMSDKQCVATDLSINPQNQPVLHHQLLALDWLSHAMTYPTG